ncbi:hypothetical protein C7C46_22005 [Streptomyces tateyamensis]|uniref:Carbohydrate esterase 2 N-terminal domain-containing protein n=2 Tax=Streptomyces tateyamensis TaxID=565073 RepID=A0A2V4P1T4_9ACTN|nr:hypothetical protein C7C46_22005 [Streptomyces tateyamensis]
MAADIDVYLRGGTYRLSQAFSLGTQDSGQNGHKVVWANYPGEVPVLSGAQQVTGFSLYDSSKNIYRAAVPVGTQSRQLFVNGVRAQRARGPLNPAGFTLSGSSFTTADSSYASFTDAASVEVVDDNAWKQMRCPLAGITVPSGGGSSLDVDPTCFRNNNTAVPNRQFPFNGAGLPALSSISYVENAYQLLDSPGEFYLNSSAGFVYYMPRGGQDLSTADVELPTRETLLTLNGTPGHLVPVNDTDPSITYNGSWSYSSARAVGDLYDDVHSTTVNGDSASYTFTGTGIDVLSEANTDEGGIDVYVDGTKTQSVSAAGTSRLAQQVVASVGGLSKGRHTVKLVKTSGTFLVLDGFTVVPDAVTPALDITFQGLTFAYTTWMLPATAGYIDNQAGVLWDPSHADAPTRIPAAVQVHRSSNITFAGDEITHTGGTGIDLADGTQSSTITGSFIHDTSGGGVSVGEVDDYYLTDTGRMTTGDTVSENWIDHVGQDYSDAVGIWAGYTRNLAISHNDIGHTPYSGISLGWGWGYASPCSMQSAQHLASCRHGTIYAGGNQILDNHVHDVMNILYDGGPIYTNGGQGNDGSTSVLAGNLVEVTNHTNNKLYQDEGSSYWNTYDNVARIGGGGWIGMWTPTIHDINIHDNYSDTSAYNNRGTNITFNQATIVSGGAWPPAAQAVIAAAGPDAGYRPMTGRIDDDDTAISYTGSWTANGNRGLGDYDDAVHATQADGDSASLTFTGTGVSVVGERSSDQGQVEVFLDGTSKGLFDTSSTTRQAQAVVYSTSGLSAGSHTVQVVKRNGTWSTLDGFEVTGVHNDTDPAITYTGASWQYYPSRGFGDYQNDVHAAAANGDSATVTFTGTGISLVTETNSDEGTLAVSLDGAAKGTVNANATSRHAQQTVYAVSGLPIGRHTLTLTKTGGTYLVIDRFDTQ